jgi:hypothetical protein
MRAEIRIIQTLTLSLHQTSQNFANAAVGGLQRSRSSPLMVDALPGVLDAIDHAKSGRFDDRLFLLEDIVALMTHLLPGILQQ